MKTFKNIVKNYGFKDVSEIVKITGVSYQTLGNWRKNKHDLLIIVLEGCRAKQSRNICSCNCVHKNKCCDYLNN